MTQEDARFSRVVLSAAMLVLALAGCGATSSNSAPTSRYPTPASVSEAIPETPQSKAYRSAGGDEDQLLERYGYRRDEYFITGTTSEGAYKTRILIARPKDSKKFSGIVVAEIFQTSVWLQVRDYLMRSGHGWVMISSRGNRWLGMLKNGSPQRYADFTLPADELNPQIMYQVVGMLRQRAASNPLADVSVRRVILSGYSGDGAAVRQFIEQHHSNAKFPDGRFVFDGYFVAATAVGSAPKPIADIEVPVIELMNENEMIRSFERGSGALAYRREDGPKYRLYEIAGAPHIMTRGSQSRGQNYAESCKEGPQSQFPMNHLYSSALQRLVLWIDAGREPPHAERISYRPDGKTIARDHYGNALGGVRSTYLDVPVARYDVVSSRNPDYKGNFDRCDMISYATAFDGATLERLYGTPQEYARRVARRADELVRDGWYLPEDAEEIKAEARQFLWR